MRAYALIIERRGRVNIMKCSRGIYQIYGNEEKATEVAKAYVGGVVKVMAIEVKTQ